MYEAAYLRVCNNLGSIYVSLPTQVNCVFDLVRIAIGWHVTNFSVSYFLLQKVSMSIEHELRGKQDFGCCPSINRTYTFLDLHPES